MKKRNDFFKMDYDLYSCGKFKFIILCIRMRNKQYAKQSVVLICKILGGTFYISY
eukprot:UN03049